MRAEAGPILDVIAVIREDDSADAVAALVDHVHAWGREVVSSIRLYDSTGADRSDNAAFSQVADVQLKRGYWDEDLGRARNDALTLSNASWALVLDIDERIVGEIGPVLNELMKSAPDGPDVCVVDVVRGEDSSRFGRFIRLGSTQYIGSEAEIIDSAFRPDRTCALVTPEVMRIERAARPDKGEAGLQPRRLARLLRDLALAENGSSNLSRVRLELAIEHQLLGDLAAAESMYKQPCEEGADDTWAWAAGEHYADLLISQGRLTEADDTLRRLEAGPNPGFARWLRARWHLASGQIGAALERVGVQEPPSPLHGRSMSEENLLRARFRIAQAAQNTHETLTSILALMTAGLDVEGRGPLLLQLWGGRRAEDLAEVIANTSTSHLDAIAAELSSAPSPGPDVAQALREERRRYTVAAVVVARDEARCIERCVRSVQPWVDEVLVADTGSVDDTVQLAQAAGARVISLPWTNDFAAVRNAALDAAAADWHIVLDADEAIAAGADQLPDLRHVSPQQVLCVTVLNSLHVSGVPVVESATVARILPGDVRYTGSIHEQPVHEYPVAAVAVIVEHDGYEADTLRGKLPEREALLRSALETAPMDSYLRHQLARNLEAQKRFAEAAEVYAEVDASQAPEYGWRHVYVVQYAHTLSQVGRSTQALSLLGENAGSYDHSPDFHFVTGNVLIDLAAEHEEFAAELLPRAAAEFRRSLEIGPVHGVDGHIAERAGVLARRNLEIVLETARGMGIPMPPHEGMGSDQADGSGALPALPEGSLDVVMIVKNEEKNLGAALASLDCLRPLLGRVCVYDTGSTDGTVALARSFGADVVEGFWDDNYSRARNAAAAMSDAPWLFVVDADERVFADATRLAVELAGAELRGDETLYVEAAPTAFETEDADALSRHWMSARLYRPDLARYARPVHAELRRVDGSRFTDEWHLPRDVVRIENDGFGVERQRASVQRALHLTAVASELRADNADRLAVHVDRARARWGAGDADGAREDLHVALGMDGTTTYHRWARQWLVRLEVETENLDAAEAELTALKAQAPTDSYTRWLEAHLRLVQGRADAAARILAGVDAVADAIGLTVPPEHVAETFFVAARSSGDESYIARAVQRLAVVRGDVAVANRAQQLVAQLARPDV